MLQGTGSDVGKSLLLAGLARAYCRRGLVVRPFKPQNMSNNAAVAADGGEIGRAQALQARACGVPASSDMNPVLLKPQPGATAQIVIQGRRAGVLQAGPEPSSPGPDDPGIARDALLPQVLESFSRVSKGADLVLVEGAGSPAEVNLRAGDIANMGFARAAGVPVVLIADIDKGGAFASVVGTWELLEAGDRDRLRGYLVNKFRGAPRLLGGALDVIAGRTGLDCLGIVPWFDRARDLPAEDAAVLDGPVENTNTVPADAIRIAVPHLPGIANFDDLDPLAAEPDVAVALVPQGRPLPAAADMVLLPGSKATLADLATLRAEGWDVDIHAHHRRGGRVLGLCGGYQLLGRRISDPEGVEGRAGSAPGLGLLAVETVLGGDKRLAETAGVDAVFGEAVRGYEIHMGKTTGPDRARPMLRLAGGEDGARSADGRVAGCYLHGLFAADGFRAAYLGALKPARRAELDYEVRVESALDDLAAHVEGAVDLDRLLALARAG